MLLYVLAAPVRVLVALLFLAIAFVRFAITLAIGGAAMLLPLVVLVAGGILAMPLYPSAAPLFQKINYFSAQLTDLVQPIVDSTAEALTCTKSPIDDVYNRLARFVFAIIRTIMDILAASPFNVDVPDIFDWATDAYVTDKHAHSYAALRIELDRLAEIERTPYADDWARLRDMNRFQGHRQLSVIDAYCAFTENTGDFIVSLLDIYYQYQLGLLEIVGLFYTPSGGFDASFIEMLVQYVVVWLVRNIPYLDCIIDPDSIDITSLSFDFNVRGLWLCICPWSYSNLSDVPDFPNIDLMVLKCICGTSNTDNRFEIIIDCIPELETAVNLITNIATNVIDTLETGVTDAVDTIISTFNGIISTALTEVENIFNKAKKLVPSDENGIPHRNGTVVYVFNAPAPEPECPRTFCPVCPARAPRPDPDAAAVHMPNGTIARLMHAARLAGIVDNMPARQSPVLPPRRMPYPWEARRAQLTPAQRAFFDDPAAHFRRLANTTIRAHAEVLYGPTVADHAETMHQGLLYAMSVLPDVWRMNSIHAMIDALHAEPIVRGLHSAVHVVAAHRAKNGRSFGAAQAHGFLRVATTAVLAPNRTHAAIASLRSAGDFAGAEVARQWLARGGVVVPSHERALAAMARERELQRLDHARTLRVRREFNRVAAENTVYVHTGAIGGSFLFSIISQMASGSPTEVGTAFIGVIGTVVQFIATSVVSILPMMLQLAANFFQNFANPEAPQKNDVVTWMTQQIVPLLADVYTVDGLTAPTIDEIGDTVLTAVSAQMQWVTIELIRVPLAIFAPTRAPHTDGNGLPDESVQDYIVSLLNAPVDAPCVKTDDCGGYPCRLDDNPAIECVGTYPYSPGMCVNSTTLCTENTDCASSQCLVGPNYNTTCTSPPCLGFCYTETCASNSMCPGSGTQTCIDRDHLILIAAGTVFGTACTDAAPCARCKCVAFPLRPYANITAPNLRTNLSADCAALGLDAAGSVPWNYASYNGNLLTFWFSLDGLRWHWNNVVTAYKVLRVVAGTLVRGWSVPPTTIFIPTFASVLWFLPVAQITSFAHTAFAGGFVRDIVGGADGVLWLADKISVVPWLGPLIADELTYVATFTAVREGLMCAFMASGQTMLGAVNVGIVVFVVGVTFIAGVVVATITLVLSVVWTVVLIVYALIRAIFVGARVARRHARHPAFTSGRPAADVPRRIPRLLLPVGHAHRHNHVHDMHIDGVIVRPPNGEYAPLGWGAALFWGVEMAVGAIPAIVWRRGRVEHVIDHLRDGHGMVHTRLNIIQP